MLAFIVAGVFVLILIAFFLLNYTHLFQSNLEGKTASEAAALSFAKDMAKVVYTSPTLGSKLALVDQPDPSLLDPNNTAINKVPIAGINTRIGIARLDAVMGAALGNIAIVSASLQDYGELLVEVNDFKSQFPKVVTGDGDISAWHDAAGKPVPAYTNAENAYKSFLRKTNSDSNYVPGSLKIKFGYTDANKLLTNIPTPCPIEQDGYLNASANKDLQSGVADNRRYYKAYGLYGLAEFQPTGHAMNGGALSKQNNLPAVFTFLAIGDAPSIVSNNDFIDWDGTGDLAAAANSLASGGSLTNLGNYLPPAMVQITAKETVKKVESADKDEPQQIAHTSSARIGMPLQPFPFGSVCIGFSSGLPVPDPAVSDNAPSVGMFNSILSMMNWSQPDSQAGVPGSAGYQGGPSPRWGWNQGSLGHWFEAQGGPLGSHNDRATDPNIKFLHTHTHKGRVFHDDPSMALSYGMYDWIKTLGVWPNISSMISALALDSGYKTEKGVPDVNSMTPHTQQYFDEGQASMLGTHQFTGANNWSLMLPAYAADTSDTNSDSNTVFSEAVGSLDGNEVNSHLAGINAKDKMDKDLKRTFGTSDLGTLTKDQGQDMKDQRSIFNHGAGISADASDVTGQAKDQRTANAMDATQTAIAFGDSNQNLVEPANAVNMKLKSGSFTSTSNAPLKDVSAYEQAIADTGTATLTVVKNAIAAYDEVTGRIAGYCATISGFFPALESAANQLPASYQIQHTDSTKDPPVTTTEDVPLSGLNNRIRADINAMKSKNSDISDVQNQVGLAKDINPETTAFNAMLTNITSITNSGNDAILAAQEGLGKTSNPAYQQVIDGVNNILNGQKPLDSIKTAVNLKIRVCNVAHNGQYANTVVVKIVQNQKLLTGIGLEEVSVNKFKLANNELYTVESWAAPTKEQILDTTKNLPVYPKNSPAGYPGTLNWNDALNGNTSKMYLYKYSNPVIGRAVPDRSVFQPAYAQSTVATTNFRMFILHMNPKPMPDGSMPIMVTVAPYTPFAKTDILEGQEVYQNTVAFKQTVSRDWTDKELADKDVPGIDKSMFGKDNFYWLVEIRDLNTSIQDVGNLENGKPKVGYFADGGPNGSKAIGNYIDKWQNWCHRGEFVGGGTEPEGQCKHVAVEFRISCPVKSSCGTSIVTTDLDTKQGQSASQPACPPPPPCNS